ncbi:MAG: EF-hand domain-containing protein [Pseudomonadota bacterium]
MWKSVMVVTASAAALSGAVFGLSAHGSTADKADGTNAFISLLRSADYLEHSEDVFERADLNGSGSLDADEFAALQVVKSELAHLNGFVRLTIAGEEKILPLSGSRINKALDIRTREDRIRIDAVARRVFYGQAGDDQHLTRDEYVSLSRDIFDSTDRNGDGEVVGAELRALGVREAAITLTLS